MSTCQTSPIGSAPGLYDFNADITNAVLLPLLVEPKVIPDIEERWSRVRDAPTSASLASWSAR
jgi:hypothetical protein